MSGRSHTIEMLLRRARQGDRAALDELVALLRPDVEQHVRSLLARYRSHKVRCDPEDVIHSVWEDLLANYHKFQDGNFELWFALRRRHRVLDRIRKEVRIADNEEAFARHNPHPPQPAADLENRVMSRNILEILDVLPPRQKAVITLYHARGWTFREIGELLGIQTTSVGTIHARALEGLRKRLREKPG